MLKLAKKLIEWTWSKKYTTDELLQRYAKRMSLFGVSSTMRIRLLHIILTNEALDEYDNNIKNSEEFKNRRQASALSRIIGKTSTLWDSRL